MNNPAGRLFLAARIPFGIKYCDWDKLSKAERESLWDDFVKSKGGIDKVTELYMGEKHETNIYNAIR